MRFFPQLARLIPGKDENLAATLIRLLSVLSSSPIPYYRPYGKVVRNL